MSSSEAVSPSSAGDSAAVARAQRNAVRMQKLSAQQNATVGTAAGVIEVIILQPLLFWKNMSQQGLPLSLNPMIMYRGLTASIGNMAILTGLQFPLTGRITQLMTGSDGARRLTDREMVGAAMLGGSISGLAAGPMELVMIQQQRFGGSLWATPARLVSQQGASSMMRGVVMSCGREGMFTAGYLGLGPALVRWLREDHGYSTTQAKTMGSIGSGIIAATLSHPMDTIKTCMQGDVERKKYGSIRETASTLLKEKGPIRFFRGWGWRTGRMCCAMAIMSECKELLSPIFFPHIFDDSQSN